MKRSSPMLSTALDRAVTFSADRIAHIRREWSRAVKSDHSSLPAYLASGPEFMSNLQGLDDAEQRKVALTISWIYADIKFLANEVSSAGLQVKKRVNERVESIIDHPFELLFNRPNSEMDSIFLLQYSIYWMSLRGKAYWYLAPEAGNEAKIAEIWPIQADRVRPVIGKDKFVEKYVYTRNNGSRIVIDPHYVVFFRYPNPFDLWDGLSPLVAASLPMDTELGSAKWQRDTYVSGRGIPHSVISLDKSLSERDFQSAAASIREDFEEERKVAITRAGDMDIKTVGISPKELELIKSRQFTRDEIDTIFLGMAIRDHSSDVWLNAADKVIKEKTIWPLHTLMAGQMTVQIMKRFYEDDVYVEFEDVRPQDRSLAVQEANIYWRVKTVNEAREQLGLKVYENKEFEDYGNLPVPLAIDPSFVTLFYDIGRLDPLDVGNLPGSSDTLDRFLGRVNQISQHRQLKPEPSQPGLTQSESPVTLTRRIANQSPSTTEAKKSEFRRWRKVALKEFSLGKNPADRDFLSDILDVETILDIKSRLLLTKTEDEIKAVFT